MHNEFKSQIYKIGINACVDIPESVTNKLTKEKGFIYVIGTINSIPFSKSLVPVKNGLYRLFVNLSMLKEGKVQVGETATFTLSQTQKIVTKYEMPKLVKQALEEKNLLSRFYSLSESKRRSILKYLSSIKSEKTLMKHVSRLTTELEAENKNIRLP